MPQLVCNEGKKYKKLLCAGTLFVVIFSSKDAIAIARPRASKQKSYCMPARCL